MVGYWTSELWGRLEFLFWISFQFLSDSPLIWTHLLLDVLILENWKRLHTSDKYKDWIKIYSISFLVWIVINIHHVPITICSRENFWQCPAFWLDQDGNQSNLLLCQWLLIGKTRNIFVSSIGCERSDIKVIRWWASLWWCLSWQGRWWLCPVCQMWQLHID